MRILVTFPLFADPAIALASFQSFNVPDVDIYPIDDNAKPEVKQMIIDSGLPIKEVNKTDQFATGCWNQTVKYFLAHPEYDCLRIGFSDVIMQENWKAILEANWSEDQAILPKFTDTLAQLGYVNCDAVPGERNVRLEGTPADCVFLSRKLVELTFPVPETIKLWYNDEYIFTIMRSLGYHTIVLENLYAYHYGSIILNGSYGAESSARIGLDQKNWADFDRDRMITRIEKLKADGFAKA